MSFLSLDRVEKTYPDGTRAVNGIDLAVEEGELVVLLGPSGCGKTTTLADDRRPRACDRRHASVSPAQDVTRLRPSRRDVGMVFQFYALYPHLTVRDNIGFPLRAAGLAAAEVRGRVDAVAARMDLERLLPLYPKQLSGGDQQKVSLARAIVRRPAVYLMDEPLGTLDADQRLAMRELIRAEQLASGVTTIYVTHDQEEAMSLADRIVVMDEGRIRQVGTPGRGLRSPGRSVRRLVRGEPGDELHSRRGGGRWWPGAVRVRGRAGVRFDVPLEGTARASSGQATLGIRCEHVHPGRERADLGSGA